SLEIREKALGAAHPMVAEVWNNLGFLDVQQRKFKVAESWLGKALEIWEHSGAADAAYAAIALSNLALLRRLQGDSRAESLYKQAIDAEERFFGWAHPEVATTLMSLAALARAQGRNTQATEIYRHSLSIVEKKLGAQDPLAVEIRERLSKLTAGGECQILLVRTRKEAEDLRARVEAGENFSGLATRH